MIYPMILTFKGRELVEEIQANTKIHSIRRDPTKRWRAGLAIQMWKGSPRNPSSKPYQFGQRECTGHQEVLIKRVPPSALFNYGLLVVVDQRMLNDDEIEALAKNDGLSVMGLIDWFTPKAKDEYIGRIIHWTDHRY